LRKAATEEAILSFLARDVPPLGYQTYYLAPALPGSLETTQALKTSKGLGETPFSGPGGTLRVDGQTGSLVWVTGENQRNPLVIELRAEEQDPKNQIMQISGTGRVFPFLVNQVQTKRTWPHRETWILQGLIGQVSVVLEASMSIEPAEFPGEAKGKERPLGTGLSGAWAPACLDLTVRIAFPGQSYLRFQLYLKFPGGRSQETWVGGPFSAGRWEDVLPGAGPHLGESRFLPLQPLADYGNRPEAPWPSCGQGIALSDPAIQLTALKEAEEGRDLIGRFQETRGQPASVKVDIEGYGREGILCDLPPSGIIQAKKRPFVAALEKFIFSCQARPALTPAYLVPRPQKGLFRYGMKSFCALAGNIPSGKRPAIGFRPALKGPSSANSPPPVSTTRTFSPIRGSGGSPTFRPAPKGGRMEGVIRRRHNIRKPV
jgi:hypothetical protein